MELKQLRYFTAVVEAGTFTAGAAALHISQPPLSVAIAKLEAELGVRLLERTPRGVEPTSAGRYLLDASGRLLGEADDIVTALGRFGAGSSGSLTMAAVPVLMWHRLPRLLRELAEESPGIEVRLIDPPPWTAIDMVQQRTADIAAIMVSEPRHFIARHGEALDIVDWGEVPLVAVLPPSESAADDPLPLKAFDDRVLVLPRGTAAVPSLPEAVAKALRRHGTVPASIRTVETIQTSLPLIEAGLAWGILPDPDHASLERFDVVVRPIHPQPEPLRALVLMRPGAADQAIVARLLAQIRTKWPDPVR